MRVAPDGAVHVAHHDVNNRDLRYARRDPTGAWAAEPVDTFGRLGEHAALALDPSGHVHVVYQDATANDLRFATRPPGGTWLGRVVEATGNQGEGTTIAVAGTTAHVAYQDVNARDLRYASGSATTPFVPELAEGSDSNVGNGASIALDADGTVLVAHHDASAGDLRLSTRAGGAWSSRTLETAGVVGLAPALRVDAGGTAHVVYFDQTNGDLRYAERPAGRDFGPPSAVLTSGRAGRSSGLALGPDGSLHVVSWLETTQDVQYAARPSMGLWSLEDALSTGDVGQYASVTVDGSGRVHAVALDQTPVDTGIGVFPANDLVYATRDPASGAWAPSVIDAAGDVGLYARIATTADGHVYLVYHEVDARDLRLARYCP